MPMPINRLRPAPTHGGMTPPATGDPATDHVIRQLQGQIKSLTQRLQTLERAKPRGGLARERFVTRWQTDGETAKFFGKEIFIRDGAAALGDEMPMGELALGTGGGGTSITTTIVSSTSDIPPHDHQGFYGGGFLNGLSGTY